VTETGQLSQGLTTTGRVDYTARCQQVENPQTNFYFFPPGSVLERLWKGTTVSKSSHFHSLQWHNI